KVEELHVTDESINIGKGAKISRALIGKNLKASGSFNESKSQDSVDLRKLGKELRKLRQQLLKSAVTDEQQAATAAVANAAIAAEDGDSSGVAKALKGLGKAASWVGGVATKIAVPIATKVIESSMGLK